MQKDKIPVSDKLTLKVKKPLNDDVVVTGKLRVKITDKDGKVKVDETHNTVTSAGFTWIAAEMAGGTDPITQMGVGTGTGGTTDLNNTKLKKALDGGYPSSAGAVVTHFCTYDPGEATDTLTEAGLFTAGAVMPTYNDGISYVKAAGDTLELTWTMTYQAP